ncbi:MAG: DNA recombination/repair protein RecA [Thermoanaerobaculia bacterium]|nr:DNA recombination/repair protein RecA [Thermoanaerobaculia bacterium]
MAALPQLLPQLLPPPGGRAAARRVAVEAWLARSGSPHAARVRTMRELDAAAAPPAPAAWSAALPAVATLFPAGLPRGTLVELSARRSAGRFAFVVELLAAATEAGETVALVDLGDALDPQQAAAAGVALPRLLWARPRDLRQTLAAAESLLGGGFPFVAVDLGLPPVPGGRGAEAQWLRLGRAAREARALLLVSTPYRACGVATGVALACARPQARWQGAGEEPRLLAGLAARLVPASAGEATAPRRIATGAGA